MANEYVSRDEVKVQLSVDLSDTQHDAVIDMAREAASRGIDRRCGRVFYVTTGVTRLFAATCSRLLVLGQYNDIVSVDQLMTDEDGDGLYETGWAAGTDYQLQPINAAVSGPEVQPYTKVVAVGDKTFPITTVADVTAYRVQIEGNWGWPVATPATIKEACLIQSARLVKRKDAPEGVVGLNMFGTVRMGKMDPDVVDMLRGYKLRTVA